jgi:phage terminase large subunit GpA-like protein
MTSSVPPTVSKKGGWQSADFAIATSSAAKRSWRAIRRKLFKRTLSPPPKLQLDEWADRYRKLSRENSAEPGQWNTDRTPYLREIMRAITDPTVEEIVVMKAARIGYTEGIIGNAIGFFIDQDPCPQLVVQPTVDDAKGWSKDNLTPLIEDTPRLSGKVKDQKSRNSGNTILAKQYPGGSLKAIGANSPRGFRRVTVRVVHFDEIDGYPVGGAGSEGDQISLGKKRALNYDNKKFIEGSTPTLKDASRVEAGFNASSKGRFYVSCPHCSHDQVLRWKNMAWDKETLADGTVVHHPETAHYVCEKCACVIEERHKRAMVLAGKYIHEFPDRRRVRGFHVSALYSLFYGARWEVLVEEFLAAKDDPSLLQVWVNTVLGETFEERGDRVDASTLASRCEKYKAPVPRGVGILTAAADIQDDRIEFKVKGWGRGQESWLIDYQVFWGDPGQADVWQALDVALRQRYKHELGAELRIRAAAIDSGGHHTDAVYSFVKTRQRRNVYAIKGHSEGGTPIWPRSPSKTNKHGVKLFSMGTDTAKDVIFSRLKRITEGPSYMHFPVGTPDEYFAQLTGEKKLGRLVKGRRVFGYVKVRPRVEGLDLEVYCLGALQSLGSAVFDHLDLWVKKLEVEAQTMPAGTSAEDTPDPVVEGTEEEQSSRAQATRRLRKKRQSRWVNGWK